MRVKPEVLASIQYVCLVAALCFIGYVVVGMAGAVAAIIALALAEVIWPHP